MSKVTCQSSCQYTMEANTGLRASKLWMRKVHGDCRVDTWGEMCVWGGRGVDQLTDQCELVVILAGHVDQLLALAVRVVGASVKGDPLLGHGATA